MKLSFELISRPIESYLVIMDDGQTIGSITYHDKDELRELLTFLKEIKSERIQSKP